MKPAQGHTIDDPVTIYYSPNTLKLQMPEEQILELVKEFFNEGEVKDDELQKFIEFADKVYLAGWREGYGLCLKNLNPSIEDLIESTKADNT